MAREKKAQPNQYRFLHDHIAREAYIVDVLDVISEYQHNALREGKGELATLETLKKSRGIKMPFTPTRNKNIAYLVDLLSKNYPEEVRALVSFDFIADPETKKLEIAETKEYTVTISNDDFNRLQEERDKKSDENLNYLLSQFRLFNITKLVNKAHNKQHLAKIIKGELGENIFSFKSYRLDRNGLEAAEDYAFHKNNYESVKKSLDNEHLKDIINAYSIQILRRLKNFGILNTTFTDYHDTKLDYLLNILIEDIPSSLSDKELLIVKNYHSLRTCLLKVEKIIDPLLTVSEDLVRYVRENGICRESDVYILFDNINEDTLRKWEEGCFERYKVIPVRDDAGSLLYLDGRILLQKIAELHRLIIFQDDVFSALSQNEKEAKLASMELYWNASRSVLASDEKALSLLKTDENVSRLKTIVKEYSDYQRSLAMKNTMDVGYQDRKQRRSILIMIGEFFKSLFGRSKEEAFDDDAAVSHAGVRRKKFSRETKDVYVKIKNRSSKIIPISDFIELTPENEIKLDTIINEIRENHLKIVIPVYNARTVLYPNRSQKYLVPDVEYLLVDTEVTKTPESIRAYTDSLVGEKLKDEVIPGSGILTVEKYLLTLYRQKRAQNLRNKGKQ